MPQLCCMTAEDTAVNRTMRQAPIWASKIMPECGFTDAETDEVCRAILCHRTGEDASLLSSVLYDADKKIKTLFLL